MPWTTCWHAPSNGDEDNALDDHQRKNKQREDDTVAKKSPRQGQVKAVSGQHMEQQTGSDRDHQNDCQQTQQPHAVLGRLIQPAGHAGRGMLRHFVAGKLPGFLVIEQFPGEQIVHRMAALVGGIRSQ